MSTCAYLCVVVGERQLDDVTVELLTEATVIVVLLVHHKNLRRLLGVEEERHRQCLLRFECVLPANLAGGIGVDIIDTCSLTFEMILFFKKLKDRSEMKDPRMWICVYPV